MATTRLCALTFELAVGKTMIAQGDEEAVDHVSRRSDMHAAARGRQFYLKRFQKRRSIPKGG